MRAPAPKVLIKAFGASSINYLAWFWIDDYGPSARPATRCARNIWYKFRRRNIEIPWPIQIQYEREEEPVRTRARTSMRPPSGLARSICSRR